MTEGCAGRGGSSALSRGDEVMGQPDILPNKRGYTRPAIMVGVEMHRYRTFISYSHKDASFVGWLYRELELFEFPPRLVGQRTVFGPVPRDLKAVFLDREDFSSGSLNAATLSALDASHSLVVVCSAASAVSAYVNEEVRLFKYRHPNRPIVPIAIDGTPPDNFPPALRFQLAADGSVTNISMPTLAADARNEADGLEVAMLKVAAGIVGVPLDDLISLGSRWRRKRLLMRAGLAVAFLALAFGLGIAAGRRW